MKINFTKHIILASALIATSVAYSDTLTVPSLDQAKPTVDYNYDSSGFSASTKWTFSGKTYALASFDVWREPVKNWDSFSVAFPLVAGYETESKASTAGFGVALNYEKAPLFASAGFYALFPASSMPDFTVGASFGVRF